MGQADTPLCRVPIPRVSEEWSFCFNPVAKKEKRKKRIFWQSSAASVSGVSGVHEELSIHSHWKTMRNSCCAYICWEGKVSAGPREKVNFHSTHVQLVVSPHSMVAAMMSGARVRSWMNQILELSDKELRERTPQKHFHHQFKNSLERNRKSHQRNRSYIFSKNN